MDQEHTCQEFYYNEEHDNFYCKVCHKGQGPINQFLRRFSVESQAVQCRPMTMANTVLDKARAAKIDLLDPRLRLVFSLERI